MGLLTFVNSAFVFFGHIAVIKNPPWYAEDGKLGRYGLLWFMPVMQIYVKMM
mgnify:CR=1 FL=1